MKRLCLMLVVTIALTLVSTSAGAAPRTPVDPGMMQPTLNPTFTWTCWRMDAKTLCDGERHDTWVGLDTGIPCAGGTIYSTGTDDRTLRRWGDTDGLALHTHGTTNIRETLSLSPDMTGTTAQVSGHFSERFLYGTPGDLSTRVTIQSGLDIAVVIPGRGLVMHDVGTKSFDIEGNVLSAHGPHELLDDFDAAFAKVCEALQG